MIRRVIRITIIVLMVFVYLTKAHAATSKPSEKEEQQCPSPEGIEDMLPADNVSISEHIMQSEDFKLKYQAKAGTLTIKLSDDGPECSIFFISYESLDKKERSTPLTFVFNGGPGASSAYLHLGTLGPKRVLFQEDKGLLAPPVKIVDNMQTWLGFTDLVFVDPIGTGYSRCVQPQENKTEIRAEVKAWGVKEDLNTLAKFIRLYLTKNNRWLSPKYLIGESYGGFRVAALTDYLQTEYDISLNGVVLISPALEFELLQGNEFSLLPSVVTLPSFAATARYHGKAPGSFADGNDIRKSLADIEFFAVQEFLPALAIADTSTLNLRLSEFIGLPLQRVTKLNSRVSPRLFAKELLQESGRLISVYDGSVTSIDPNPSSPFSPGIDPYIVQLNNLLAAAFNSYIREQLKFETDIPYKILNREVSRNWNWRSGLDGAQGFTGVASNLRKSMSINKELRVLIAHGIFDLVTPYFGSVIVSKQMLLDSAIAPNLSLKNYEGGHMFYTNEEARMRFFEDTRQFFTSISQ